MSSKPLEITHTGQLKIGEIVIPVAVLEDGTRIISQADFQSALDRTRNPASRKTAIDNLPAFIEAKNLKPFIDDDVRRSLIPIWFRPAKGGGVGTRGGHGGIGAHGYPGTLLPEVCKVYLRAREAGVLTPGQQATAKRAE